MRKVTICLIVLGVLALAFISMPMRAQNQGYPPEFSPLRTFRTPPAQRSLVPATKFLKLQNPIPNKYIVVLNDDVVSSSAPVDVRRAQVSAIANSLAQAHGGKRGFVYETALKGFSIELPNEAAAIALSQNPQVKWVEGDGVVQEATVCESNPPWGLDRIDQITKLPVGGVDGTSYLSTYAGAAYCYNNTGSGVVAYVIDRGVRTSHQDFGTRTLTSIDCTGSTSGSADDCVNDTLTTGSDHGTHVAGILGGTTYGVAKGVTLRSIRTSGPVSTLVAAANWVTRDHNNTNNVSIPVVVNISLGCPINDTQTDHGLVAGCGNSIDAAVQNSINAGLTYAIAAGNGVDDRLPAVDASTITPADVPAALTIGASNLSDVRGDFSNFGQVLDLFAPGVHIPSPSNSGVMDTSPLLIGTSLAAPHVAGAVASYLEGRTAASGCDCFSLYNSKVPDNSLPASSYAKLSTCPDRVAQFIKSNATLAKLDASTIGAGSANRLLNTSTLSAPTNPIDNQRFFVWQHYADFLPKAAATPVNNCDSGNPENGKLPSEPDESGLDFWTSQITAACGTGTDFNANNACTPGKRVDVSRAFWVAVYPSWFNTGPNSLTNFNPAPYASPNEKWLDEVYWVYLRRRPPHSDPNPVNWDPGFKFWFDALNSGGYGNPANQAGVDYIIKAFIESLEYRERSGQP